MNGSTDTYVESHGKSIENSIRRQYDFILVSASSIANVKDNLRNLREHFIQAVRSLDANTPDAFEQADLRVNRALKEDVDERGVEREVWKTALLKTGSNVATVLEIDVASM